MCERQGIRGAAEIGIYGYSEFGYLRLSLGRM